ncbi:hypothetical protein PAXRUDRAFT_129609, partial [Paxillus rubicundulus Ve08.2h10]
RVVVVGIDARLITARILQGIAGVNVVDAEDILIPRFTFETMPISGHALHRRRFPLHATTFNKD